MFLVRSLFKIFIYILINTSNDKQNKKKHGNGTLFSKINYFCVSLYRNV